jgi:NitT/TauT family transport system permease protein
VSKLFELRGKLKPKTALTIEVGGFIALISIWALLSESGTIPSSLLPSPLSVLRSFSELVIQDSLFQNLAKSMAINFMGYGQAILICLPVGFIIGLFPFFREMFRRYLDAIRFLPLTAITGLFIAWFGIENTMKIQFLAFGISVYLLPVVVQRIQEVDNVYCDTVYTLGASKWQTIRHVFVPEVFSKISDDIRVLVAISWTYIIVAEMINKGDGGIGALAYTAARQSRVDKVFAILFVIIAVGIIQDRVASIVDKWIFAHKHSGGSTKEQS